MTTCGACVRGNKLTLHSGKFNISHLALAFRPSQSNRFRLALDFETPRNTRPFSTRELFPFIVKDTLSKEQSLSFPSLFLKSYRRSNHHSRTTPLSER